MRVLHILGARPNFMKVAPLFQAMARRADRFEQSLVHTGQHYDDELSEVFFRDLALPYPDVYLNVGSASHAKQTALAMMEFEPVLLEQQPDLVVVVGDVNSTLASALVACKLHVPVAHIEAGLRSFDRSMPEEINRILTDQISDLLFTTERSANKNLESEGISGDKIHFVGNTMIDTPTKHRERALALNVLSEFGVKEREYVLVTLHRPSNVDVPQVLSGILDALDTIQAKLPVIFPAHPRTVERIRKFGFETRLAAMDQLRITDPLGYLEFLNLMANARLVLTDSGGIQEETTILNVPCLTLRENTERPVTVTQGTNTIVGSDPEVIIQTTLERLDSENVVGQAPELWDGKAAMRIVKILDKEARGQ